jgi:TAG lipase/steryl ester hydrolase/phospholipase A2/LPA acyltransferase
MGKSARKYQDDLTDASSYSDWLQAAQALDCHDGMDKWRAENQSDLYDHKLIASRTSLLRRLRRKTDYEQLVFRLREEIHGNLGNMANPTLYQHARAGTKNLINTYLDEVTAALNLLCDSDVKSLPPSRKRRFFNRAARSFGRSALLLSGGASLGLFHIGVIEELMEQHLLPQVITGASAGSIIGGFLATHTDEELEQALKPDELNYHWVRVFGLSNVIKGDGVLDPKQLRRSIDRNIQDLTFLEAYEKTGRILNISISPADPHQFPRLLNYLSSPNVLIRQAALASSAIPGLFPPVQLRARNFEGKSGAYMPQSRGIDGSVHEDIPKENVKRQHNVNHYIVSQINPHVVPFLNDDMERTGLFPFLQDVVVKGPLVQVEHVLDMVHRHFDVPGLGSIVKKAHAIVGQNYSGDITIYPAREEFHFSKMFSNVSKEEAKRLIDAGRRATWPRIERIRNTTQISRTFTDCLDRLAERYYYVKR